jgi:hypothetical protein
MPPETCFFRRRVCKAGGISPRVGRSQPGGSSIPAPAPAGRKNAATAGGFSMSVFRREGRIRPGATAGSTAGRSAPPTGAAARGVRVAAGAGIRAGVFSRRCVTGRRGTEVGTVRTGEIRGDVSSTRTAAARAGATAGFHHRRRSCTGGSASTARSSSAWRRPSRDAPPGAPGGPETRDRRLAGRSGRGNPPAALERPPAGRTDARTVDVLER